jgi:hypothetical protein
MTALLLLALAAPADADFLNPANWQGRDDIWTVKDGVVTGETKENPKYNTFLASKAEYGDFELSYKVRLRDGIGNSGVQVRSVLKSGAAAEKKFVVHGPQADAAPKFWGALYGEGVGGYLVEPTAPVKADDKGFVAYTVKVVGNRITIAVNGETTVDQDIPSAKGGTPAPARGIIAFQCHQGPPMKVEFTDIKFTDLTKK